MNGKHSIGSCITELGPPSRLITRVQIPAAALGYFFPWILIAYASQMILPITCHSRRPCVWIRFKPVSGHAPLQLETKTPRKYSHRDTGTYSANIGQDLYELRKYSYLRECLGEYMWEGILCHKWLLMGIDYSSKEPRFKYVCKLTGLERYESMDGTLAHSVERPLHFERVD